MGSVVFLSCGMLQSRLTFPFSRLREKVREVDEGLAGSRKRALTLTLSRKRERGLELALTPTLSRKQERDRGIAPP